MRLLALEIILFLNINLIQCQDMNFARQTLDKLTGIEFWGRGYTNHGMEKASGYLKSTFISNKLQPLFGKSFYQEFSYSINTFPGKMQVRINEKALVPGKDFLISPDSKGVSGTFRLTKLDSAHFRNIDGTIQVNMQKKLTWSTSGNVKPNTTILLLKESIDRTPSEIQLQIENKFIQKFKAKNVGGIIYGKKNPDSLIVITAHYDHLGGMGADTYFPGANDDASGVTLLLTLAKYYSNNIPDYSVAFLCFAGEEAGLLGSEYFVNHTTIELSKIKFLVNLDLTGTGEDGITAVNGSIFKKEFSQLNKINDQKGYLTEIKSRGKAANSDHYWFTEKGVPSFFIYAMGGIQAYHDIYDRPETLPLTEFKDLFNLIIDFNSELMH